MPFDKALYQGYCVCHSARNRENKKIVLFFAFFVLWVGVLTCTITYEIKKGPIYLAGSLMVLGMVGWAILEWFRKPEPEGMRIWVLGDKFCTQQNALRSRYYRFFEITSVSYCQQFSRQHRAFGAEPQWRIYVEEECVAFFQKDMENADNLLSKLDKLGFITPYGTGYKPKEPG